MSLYELRSNDGRIFTLDSELTRFGRAQDNTLVINDPAISRYHLNFYIKDGSLIVEDAGSQNGFLLNGEKITGVAQVAVGDKIFVGSREYQIAIKGQKVAEKKAPAMPKLNLNLSAATLKPSGSASRRPMILGVVVIVLIAAAYQNSQKPAERAPAADKTADKAGDKPGEKPTEKSKDELTQPLNSDGYRPTAFRQKSITEVQAESKFQEAMRDYSNANFSLALLGFRDALTLNPAHEPSAEYLQLAEKRLTTQLDDLLKDGQRSYSNLQYQRAKIQMMRILTILSEQIPGYGNKVARDAMNRSEGSPSVTQEDNLLKLPCDKTKEVPTCKSALEILTKCREQLGEEDTLK